MTNIFAFLFRPLFRHLVYNLRGGFLIRPIVTALVLGLAGAALSSMEEIKPALSAWVPSFLFPSRTDPQVAQVILSSIATSMMTVVSIVFAILLMTLTLASNQFSPRIIVNFARDRVTQQTLGIFLGTFAYCISALPAARAVPQPFAPVVTVIGAMLLALGCVACLLYFIHHISQSISVNYIVDNIARETESVINQTMPRPLRQARLTDRPSYTPTGRELAVCSVVSGYIRFIDTKLLVSTAKGYGVHVRVLRRVGHFVPEGVPLLIASKEERLSPAVIRELLSTFDFGPTRTLEQDIEFGILQIVDIALKAISPAVNDPSTAISCVDQLSRILIRYVSREPADSLFYDPPSVLRVSLPEIGLERLIEAAFDQIRLYAKSDVAVNLRLLRALGDIASTTPIPEYRRLLIELGRRILVGGAEKLTEAEMAEMRRRLSALEAIVLSDATVPSHESIRSECGNLPTTEVFLEKDLE